MKSPYNQQFNSHFERNSGLKWYPYVGENFGKQPQRVVLYAQIIPFKPTEFDLMSVEFPPGQPKIHETAL